MEVPVSREDHQRAHRDGEVHERDDTDRLSEAEIEAAPDNGNGQDQDREQDEERLLLAQVFVVLRVRADPGDEGRAFGPPADASWAGRR